MATANGILIPRSFALNGKSGNTKLERKISARITVALRTLLLQR